MDYRATLNLPKTKFKMKADLSRKEPELLKRWDKEDLYGQVNSATAGRPLYLLHDGPPYANGHIHLGTAFNKVLKDIILKSKRMAGFHSPYVPGWDCHGLPIEHNVDKELGKKKQEISKLKFRNKCRDYAKKWIKIQKAEFKRLGVLGDWDNPYLTMNYGYEASIAREFNRFLISGSVVRSKKPVYWCSSCKTALAEAEIEYHDHTSPSIYVKFKVTDDLGDVIPELAGKEVFAVIWTTTPWTLPANLAIAFHPDFPYSAVDAGGEIWIVAQGLVEQLSEELKGVVDNIRILTTFSAGLLEGRTCDHPFIERESLMILAPYVTLETGTGCVHTAPGHGREDYISGVRYNLPILSPVDDNGKFTDQAGPYASMNIFDANKAINRDMAEKGVLIKEDSITHSYPHCWRCKRPVIFRATEQWFISMEKNNLRKKAMAAIKDVTWTPKWGIKRILDMVDVRPDWCLSRQRAWGVPITVIYCEKCGEIIKSKKVAEKIDKLFKKEGANSWYTHDAFDFLGPYTRCPKCRSDSFKKEEDILDVWFDSGVSYAAVLEETEGLSAPCDLYLEGSDQHRGWFQSSLLASVGTRGIPPYRSVLTHGFVVDGKGKKMSKSLGNVIAPSEIIDKHGAEILRLWVASEDYRDDIKISNEILGQLTDAYRKIRNTIRYMLSNLFDFDPSVDSVAVADMEELDQWALHQFELLKTKVKKAYESFDFHSIFHAVHNFCTVTMSSFYFDIIKDRLYTAPPASKARRSAQTVLNEIVDGLLRLMAPVLSFTSVEAWEYLPLVSGRESNIFLATFPKERKDFLHKELATKWQRILEVRSEITKALEIARQDKVIGHSLEAEVLVSVKGDLADFLKERLDTFQTISIVSAMRQVDEIEGACYRADTIEDMSVLVRPAPGEKCERCWMRSESVGQDNNHPQLCARCVSVMGELA